MKFLSYISRSLEDHDVFDSIVSFRISCLFSRHTRSNHVLLDALLIRLKNFLMAKLRQIFDVIVKVFIVSLSEM